MKKALSLFRSVTLFAAILGLPAYMSFSTPQVELETARYAFRHGDFDQAMRFARRAALLGDGSTKKEAYRLVAAAADELGRPDVAEKYLKLAGPSSQDAEGERLWQEGEALLQRGGRAAALRRFKRSYALAPDPDKASQIAWMLGQKR